MIDAGVEFWLRHVEDRGGLWEPAGDSVLVMLPPELCQRYRLADSLHVTSDPDVAREDGVALLSAGHPVLAEAAESVLGEGDAGLLVLDQPVAHRPADQQLLDQARTQPPVSHGRIDLAGPSGTVTRWLLRVGLLASYTVSAEDRVQEQLERWVDVASRPRGAGRGGGPAGVRAGKREGPVAGGAVRSAPRMRDARRAVARLCAFVVVMTTTNAHDLSSRTSLTVGRSGTRAVAAHHAPRCGVGNDVLHRRGERAANPSRPMWSAHEADRAQGRGWSRHDQPS